MQSKIYFGDGHTVKFDVPGSTLKVVFVGGQQVVPAAIDFSSVTLSSAPAKGVPIDIEWGEPALPGGTESSSSNGNGAITFTATPFSSAILLDLVAGREMGTKKVRDVAAPITLSVAPNPAVNGNFNLTLVADGVNAVSLAAGAFANGSTFKYTNSVGQVHEISGVYRPLGALIFCELGGVVSDAGPLPIPPSTRMKDSFTVPNSTHTDGAGNASVDQHMPDVSNLEGARWTGSSADSITSLGGLVGHGNAERFCYPITAAPPQQISASFSLVTGDALQAGVVHFRDDGSRGAANYYFLYVTDSTIQMFKAVSGTYTKLAETATAAWANGANSTLLIQINNTANTVAVFANGASLFTGALDALSSSKGIGIGCNAGDYAANGRKVTFTEVEVIA